MCWTQSGAILSLLIELAHASFRKKHAGSGPAPAASTDSAASVLPVSTTPPTTNGTSEAPVTRASAQISPSDLSAAKRKSVLKAYVLPILTRLMD